MLPIVACLQNDQDQTRINTLYSSSFAGIGKQHRLVDFNKDENSIVGIQRNIIST